MKSCVHVRFKGGDVVYFAYGRSVKRIISDEKIKLVAGAQSFGSGTVLLFGYSEILEYNFSMLKNTLKYLTNAI